jgi:diguanylate cyclase
MFTRVEGDDWVVLDAIGDSYPFVAGSVLKWSDSCCARLVAGEGPMIASNINEVPAYASAPVAAAFPILSYVGLPIFRKDGSLFGTMCAIDSEPVNEIERYLPLVELVAGLLGFAVDRQSEADDSSRRAEAARTESHIDGLTGILNRKGWDSLVGLEDERCRQYGYPASIYVVDLDGFKSINDTLGHQVGDDVLRKTAQCLKATFRERDIVARTGGDEFSILAVECEGVQGERLHRRLEAELARVSIAASVGFAYCPATRLGDVWKSADEAMYVAKRKRSRVRLASSV